MWKLGLKHPTSLAVLHFLISKTSPGHGLVMSTARLAKQMGIAHRTVQKTIPILRACKFLKVLKLGNSNVYVVNSRLL